MAVTTDMVKFYYGAALPEVGIETNALYFIPDVGLYKGNQLIANTTQIGEGSEIADLIQEMINASIGGLGNAIKFLGRTSTAVTDGGTQIPTIGEATIPLDELEAGDVVLYGDQEFIWTIEGKWELFGDEGSYALDSEVKSTYATKAALEALEKALKTDGTITVKYAENATNAENAQTAVNATNAENAKHATTADSATNATNAENATNAGSAEKAGSLIVDAAIGNTNKPVYINAEGKPVAIDYEINETVPEGALFTDTVTTINATVEGTGNAITNIVAENGQLTLHKETKFVVDDSDYTSFTDKAKDAYAAVCWNTI